MDILEQLSNIVNSNFGQFCGGEIILEETERDSTTKKITIKKTGRLYQTKFDEHIKDAPDLFPYFTTEEGVRKISDYLLFYLKNNKLYIFVCELKSKKAKGSGKQIEAAYIFAQFLVNTLSRMQNFKEIKAEYRGLLFSPKGAKKGNSKVKNPYLEYPNSKLKYRHLKDGDIYNLDTLCV